MKAKSITRLAAAVLLPAFLGFGLAFPAAAVTITGTVTNGTTQKPSAGDRVTLISLSQQMQEVAHATTDARGRYSLTAPAGNMHLVRVDHQNAAYFQPAPPNSTSVNVDVYDVAAAVKGVTTEANVIRMETTDQGLKVIQSFFVKNASNPPRTQFSQRAYEFYLPAKAEIEASAAMGPGGMPVRSSPMPFGDKGGYAFVFPIRPGETQFQVTYHLPYSGSLAFTPRLATPADDFVVMLPKEMKFQPGARVAFEPVGQPVGAQTYLVRNAQPSQKLMFTVSGSGQLPANIQGGGENAAAGSAGAGAESNVNDRPGIGLGKPIDTPDPLNKYKWWILGCLGLLFAIAAGFFLRRPAGPPLEPDTPLDREQPLGRAGCEPALLTALKDELFAIETDRMQGKLSEQEYGELKSALELVLRRALGRQPA